MLASQLITRALRLINEPGSGVDLSDYALNGGFDSLRELLQSKSVSRILQPGIRTHFFALTSGKSIFTYGVGPQADFRSDDFGDPAPIEFEDAYVRTGVSIVNNEQVDEFRFENAGTWSTTGDVAIVNNTAEFSGVGILSQSIPITPGTTWTIRLKAVIDNLSLELKVFDGVSGEDFRVDIDESGVFEFDITVPAGGRVIQLEAIDASTQAAIDYLSIIERGKDRLELPTDGKQSDYPVDVMDQRQYNREHSKGTSGRPYRALYTRTRPLATLKFDHGNLVGDILVADVRVDLITPENLYDELNVHNDALRFLRYALAQDLAPEYGKKLTQQQLDTMDEARRDMGAGGRKSNKLRTSQMLGRRTNFNINRGDP